MIKGFFFFTLSLIPAMWKLNCFWFIFKNINSRYIAIFAQTIVLIVLLTPLSRYHHFILSNILHFGIVNSCPCKSYEECSCIYLYMFFFFSAKVTNIHKSTSYTFITFMHIDYSSFMKFCIQLPRVFVIAATIILLWSLLTDLNSYFVFSLMRCKKQWIADRVNEIRMLKSKSFGGEWILLLQKSLLVYINSVHSFFIGIIIISPAATFYTLQSATHIK